MLKNSLSCLLFFFVCFTATAQSSATDSLQKIITKERKDSNTVKALLKLAETYRWEKPDSGIYYAEQAIQQNTRLNLSPRYTAFAWNSIGYAQYMKGDYPGAIKAFESYYTFSEKANDLINMGFALNNEAGVHIELGNYVKAMEKYQQALTVRQKANDKGGIAMSYNNIGFIYKDIGDYEKAIHNFLFALREYEQLDDKKAVAKTHNFIGIVYAKKKEYSKAISHLEQGIAIQKAVDDKNELAISYQSIASIYKEQEDYNRSVSFLNDAMKVYESSNDLRQIALVQADLGEIYLQKKKYDSAAWYFTRSVELNSQIGNKRNMASSRMGLAQASIHQKNYILAKQSLDSAYAVIETTNKKDDLKNYFLVAADYYSATGNPALAFELHKKYAAIKDTLLNEANVKAIADMEVKYETEKKEQEIKLQQSEISRKNIVIAAVAGLLALVILLGFSAYRRYRLQQQARLQAEIMRQQELATKAVIEAEEEERKRIARDLHDGVGQMMSAAKMNLSAFESEIKFASTDQQLSFEKIISLVDESCKEVRSVSHNMMPNALLKSSLSSAVQDFIDKLDKKTIQVHLYTEGLDQRLDANVETVLYRVIQECVNNVIKHSGANTLDISVIRDTDGISATIEDNGKGFDTKDKSKFDGIGMKNISTRVEYLKGTVDFDSTPGKGTLVAVHVPL